MHVFPAGLPRYIGGALVFWADDLRKPQILFECLWRRNSYIALNLVSLQRKPDFDPFSPCNPARCPDMAEKSYERRFCASPAPRL